LTVSRLALGTMTWGVHTDPDDAAAQLKAFLDAGGDLVDTADVYGDGDAEMIIGALLNGVVSRRDIIVATKSGARPGAGPNCSRWHLLAALDASLARLGTDHVDLWQIHGYDPRTPVEETLAAADHAVSSGRARYVGLSAVPAWHLARAATWQTAWPGRTPLISVQTEYSLLCRYPERELIPACTALGVGVLARSPLGRGVLTGKYRGGTPSDSRAALAAASPLAPDPAPASAYLDPHSAGIVEAVATAADGLGVSPVAVSLSWVRDRPGVVSSVVGARTVGQLLGSLRSESLELPGEIRLALDDVSAGTVTTTGEGVG